VGSISTQAGGVHPRPGSRFLVISELAKPELNGRSGERLIKVDAGRILAEDVHIYGFNMSTGVALMRVPHKGGQTNH